MLSNSNWKSPRDQLRVNRENSLLSDIMCKFSKSSIGCELLNFDPDKKVPKRQRGAQKDGWMDETPSIIMKKNWRKERISMWFRADRSYVFSLPEQVFLRTFRDITHLVFPIIVPFSTCFRSLFSGVILHFEMLIFWTDYLGVCSCFLF